MRTSLSGRLLAWILPVSLAVVVAASLLTYLIARSVILGETRQSLEAVTEAAAAQVTGYFEQRDSELATVAQSPLFRDHYMNVEYGLRQEAGVYGREIERMLRDLQERARAYPELAYTDARGRAICLLRDGRAAPPGQFDAEEDFFVLVARLRTGRRAMSAVVHVPWHGAPIVRYGAALRDESGRLRGALVFSVSLQPVYEALGRLRLGSSGRSFLSARRPAQAYEDLPSAGRAELLTAAAAVPGTPWSVLTVVRRGDFLEPLAWVATATLALGLLGCVVLIVVLGRQVRRLLRPLRGVAAAAEAYAAGDLSARVDADGPDEVRALAEAFNAMADRLQQRAEENERLHAATVQAEKMSAVGSLIAGVAHELNNPLAAVTGFAELLKDVPARPEEREDLRHLHQSALRCRDIVQGLLLFVRKGKGERRRLSLNNVVQATLALVEYRLIKTEGIALRVELDPAAPAVAGDFQKLQQVLVNLLGNAADALAGRLGERVIRVATRAFDGGVEVVVEDSGPGVAPELRAAIFEPFFTTKAAGAGTGLGLSISSDIVAEHGGRLACADSTLGGARFSASFPPCPVDLPESESSLPLPPSAPGRRVLVVDDEPDLVKLMTRLLSEDGLLPAAASDLGQALELLASQPFDLVISDVDMGKDKGTALLAAARRLPRAPAFVLVTGDVLNQSLGAELAGLGVPVLAKPFLRTEFLRVARRALRSAAPR